MNPETLAALSPVSNLFAKFDAKTIEVFSKMCNPLAGIITPELARMCNRLAMITPELAAALSTQIPRHIQITKLVPTILPRPSRR